MSKVNAFRCDCCNEILEEDNIIGFAGNQSLFNPIESFPVEFDNNKAVFHICTECYRQSVLIPAENAAPKKKGEAEHQRTVKDLSFLLKKKVIDKINNQKIKKVR